MLRRRLNRFLRRTLGVTAPLVWRRRPSPSLVILTYHRVLPAGHPARRLEQPGMYVSPETLAMHLQVLKEHFTLVDLGTWLSRRAAGDALPVRACCVTFDDGWRDNHSYALPVLEMAQVPATVFLVSDFIGSHYRFWPNRLATLLSGLDERRMAMLPHDLAVLLAKAGWVPESAPDIAAIDRVICACKNRSDAEMIGLLDAAEDAGAGTGTVADRDLLDRAEILAMRDTGLVQFGSHSRRHTRLLPALTAQQLEDELQMSRASLEQLIGREVDLFCYPNGDWSPAALALVRKTYRAAVTTVSGWNMPDSDPHLLRRLSVHEDISADPASFLARVAGLR
jgi:peptidoglycan/xylan/chitin deacetylase (PgdA/CDA1 family)